MGLKRTSICRVAKVWAFALLSLFSISDAVADEAPERVVSMNLCTDQLAMLLAAPGQLVSISYLAHDPNASVMATEAADIPANHGLAEEIFLLKPDLVLAGTFTTRATVEMLRRLGRPVEEFAPANSLADIRERLAQMGRALGREDAAQRLRARFDANLTAARAKTDARPRAATYYANGYTSGSGTLAASVMEAAGLANIAIELGYDGGGRLPLEQLVMQSPDLIVGGREYEGTALAEQMLQHPALAAIREQAGAAPVADRHWVCGTPFVVAAIRRLVVARDAVLAGR